MHTTSRLGTAERSLVQRTGWGVVISLLMIATTLIMGGGAPASAEVAPAPEEVVSTLTSGTSTMGSDSGVTLVKVDPTKPISLDKGSGGSTSASGCARFWVNNIARNLLGSKAFEVRIWTDACWNRANHVVSINATGQTIRYVGSTWDYKGITSTDRHFYSWSPGYTRSGYHHYRLLRFDNCIIKYGCIGSNYSRQAINVHSNGTWTWSTDGDTNG